MTEKKQLIACEAFAHGNAVSDQYGQVRRVKADAWGGTTVVLDVRVFVVVVRESTSQVRTFRMRLRIVPADTFLAAKDTIVVVQQFAI